MLIDLTTSVEVNNPLLDWAKSHDNPHIAMGHVGTHLDIYEKTSIPLEYFKSSGIVFDVRNIAEIDINDIDVSSIAPDTFVFFYTGQTEKYSYGEKEYFHNHPQLSHTLIDVLLNKKNRFIGMDCAGIRQTAEHEYADRLCEKNNIYVIENLQNLSQITSKKCTIYTMWFDDAKMTGLKCRVIAECS